MKYLISLVLCLLAAAAFAAFCPTTPPTTATCNFFVSTTGSNLNNGITVGTPFLTLTKAKTAAQGATQKVICLRAGTYALSSGVSLTSADSGETWQFYPPDGVNTAVIDGGGTTDGLFQLNNATNVTINGLKLANPLSLAVFDGGGSTGLTVENSDIGNNRTGNSGLGFSGFGPLVAGGSQNFHFLNNYVHDFVSMGVVANGFNAGTSIAGTVYSGNFLENGCTGVSDCGALYVSMHGGEQGPAHTVQIKNNFIRNLGAPGVSGVNDIYLDDNQNNTDVSGNIVGPLASGAINVANWVGCGSGQAFCIHNGHDNAIFDNIVDLGLSASQSELIVTYGCDGASISGMAGNSFTGNIVVANWAGTPTNGASGIGFGVIGFLEGSCTAINGATTNASWFNIQNNDYVNYGGGTILTNGAFKNDTNALHPTTTQLALSGFLYALGANSIALSAPVNFTQVVGGFGPPGFSISATTNHSAP